MIDKNRVGEQVAEVEFPIERSKLMELARAFGDDDPVWCDDEAARAAGFDGIPTPPTVTVLADHWREGGALEIGIRLGGEVDRMLHGEARWEYHDQVRVGDRITARSTVTGVRTREGKRGGRMTLVTVVTDYTNQSGRLVGSRHDVMIETQGD